MKQNLTLRLDDELLYRAKIVAAERRKSLSELIRDYLTHMVNQRPKTREEALAKLKRSFAKGLFRVEQKSSRDELHDR